MHRELGEKEVRRTETEQPEYAEMARWYLNRYQQNLDDFEACGHNILTLFRRLEEEGVVELITTCATHAYLPLYQEYPQAINAQIELGIQSHLNAFGHISRGFWLPECGYFPGLEQYLKSKGVSWFQTASQSMLLSPDKVEDGTFRPVRCPTACGVSRDYEATSLVWSNTSGYPCDPRYREFYRDIGYDLPMDYIGPYVEEDGNRIFTDSSTVPSPGRAMRNGRTGFPKEGCWSRNTRRISCTTSPTRTPASPGRSAWIRFPRSVLTVSCSVTGGSKASIGWRKCSARDAREKTTWRSSPHTVPGVKSRSGDCAAGILILGAGRVQFHLA
jgi:hypothetical protein